MGHSVLALKAILQITEGRETNYTGLSGTVGHSWDAGLFVLKLKTSQSQQDKLIM